VIVKRLYPPSLDELKKVVADHARDASCVAVQAGHFLVYYDHTEDQLLPCVASELNGPRHDLIKNEVGHFPLLTWQIGLEILSSIPAPRKHIMTIVNDWQYLPKNVDRSRFYEKHQRIPTSYQTVLEQRKDVQLLRPPRLRKALYTGDFFSEQTLRNQYRRHVTELIAQGKLPSNFEVTKNGETISCSLVDAVGNKQEIYCTGKGENCTHEVAELIHAVSSLSRCDVFVNLFPLVCKKYVETGTELSFELFRPQLKRVINVGMQASQVLDVTQLLLDCYLLIQER